MKKDEVKISTKGKLNEETEKGFFSKIFARIFGSFLLKFVPGLSSAVNKTERNMEKARKKIEERAGGDKEKVKEALSPRVRKALGFDY